MQDDDDKQDLGIAEVHAPDMSWARMQPVQIVASKDRLDAPSTRVTIKNTSPNQIHIVIDRHMVGHELQPGESKHDIEMLDTEIEYFIRQRAPGRFDRFGKRLDPHPIVIDGMERRTPEREPTVRPRPQARAR